MTKITVPASTEENRSILMLMADGITREPLRRAFLSEKFVVSFVGSISEVTPLLSTLRPLVFLHDFSVADASQGRQLQGRLSHFSEFNSTLRVCIVDAISQQTLAMANEYDVARLVTSSTSLSGLVSAVNMAVAAARAATSLRVAIREIRSGARKYDQTAINTLVATTYAEYPYDPDVKVEYGNLLLRKGAHVDAIHIGNELLSANPSNVRAMNLVSRALMREGKFDDAARVLQAADALSPDHPERLVLIGDAFFGKGEIASARTAYGKAHALDPTNKGAAEGLGQIALGEGDAQAALALFRGSLSEEESVGFFNNAGVAAVKAGKTDQGLHLYETALEALHTATNRHLILFNMALAHRKAGRRAEAIKALRKGVKHAPNFEKASKLLATLESEEAV